MKFFLNIRNIDLSKLLQNRSVVSACSSTSH